MKTTNRLIALFAALLLLATACGDGADTAETTTPTTTAAPTTTATVAPTSSTPVGLPPGDYAGFRAQSTACGANPPAELETQQYSAPEDLELDPAVKLTATITTSCGEIVVELDPGVAPETVNSFVFLANRGYFDGTVSHRIVPGFIVQAGDPTATGFGGPGYVVPDEFPPQDFLYETGILAMANAGPSSTGSQFFIMLSDRGLPPLYSVYGIVVDGFDTLDRLQQIPLGPTRTGEASVPLETVYIESVVIEPSR